MQFFTRGNPVVIPEMNYGVQEIPGANPYKLGMGDNRVYMYEKFGPEPDPTLFQNFLNNRDVIRLNPNQLQIPEPSQGLKNRPGYTPTILPGLRDHIILGGGFGVT